MVVALVVLTFVAFILWDHYYRRSAVHAASEERVVGSDPNMPFGVSDVHVPDGVFLGRGHIWARLEQNGDISLGVDDFTAKLVAGVKKIETLAKNVRLCRGKPIFSLHVGESKKLDFFAPFEGHVLEVNHKVLRNPSLIALDTYRSGWLMRIRAVRLASTLKVLRLAEDAKEWMREEIIRLRDFLSRQMNGTSAAPALTDGGLILPEAFLQMGAEGWEAFQKEFLEDY
ncbi:MAG: hypothetical protein JSV08_08645 [Acidobacteriota bacterium]|nr:MAG: hypothetical protein JSV08_08645 [Acidobacteriota bacterium]